MPSRREVIRMTDDEVRDFLDGRRTMSVATVGRDGQPHLVAMWYGFLDGAPAFWTYAKSQKILNLRRDPRITCMVEEGNTYAELRGVELVGKGAVIDDRDAVVRLGENVHVRYNGPLTDEVRAVLVQMGQKRVAVRIDADQIVSWDHRKLGGQY